jgi:hypothetical protein
VRWVLSFFGVKNRQKATLVHFLAKIAFFIKNSPSFSPNCFGGACGHNCLLFNRSFTKVSPIRAKCVLISRTCHSWGVTLLPVFLFTWIVHVLICHLVFKIGYMCDICEKCVFDSIDEKTWCCWWCWKLQGHVVLSGVSAPTEFNATQLPVP